MTGLYSTPRAELNSSEVRKAVDGIRRAKCPAVFYCNALGDHLLIRPTILALQKELNGKLGFIGISGHADKFFSDASFRIVRPIAFYSDVDDAHMFDPNDVIALRDEFDALINLNWWDAPYVQELSTLLEDLPQVHLASSYGHVNQIADDEHIADHAFKVAKLFNSNLAIENFVSVQPTGQLAVERARQIRSYLPPHGWLLAAHTYTRDDKRWTQAAWRNFLDSFLDRHEECLVLVVDREDAGLDTGRHQDRIVCLEGVDLLTSTVLVSQCDAFVGIDSYFLHVADFAGLPTVAIFGSTSTKHWGCRFTRSIHVEQRPTSAVPVQDVLDAIENLLQEAQSHSNGFARTPALQKN